MRVYIVKTAYDSKVDSAWLNAESAKEQAHYLNICEDARARAEWARDCGPGKRHPNCLSWEWHTRDTYVVTATEVRDA